MCLKYIVLVLLVECIYIPTVFNSYAECESVSWSVLVWQWGNQAIYDKKLNSGIFGDCTSESFQIYHGNDFTLLTCDLDLI